MSNDRDAWRRAADLTEQVSYSTSPDEVWCWAARHLEQLDDSFFEILEGRAPEVAARVRTVLDQRDVVARQAALLDSALAALTYAQRRERLRQAVPQLHLGLFRLLACRVEEGAVTDEAALALCDELLRLIPLNDLRDEWPAPEGEAIRGAVWFLGRRERLRTLIEAPHDERLLPYDELRRAASWAWELARKQRLPGLGVALLNVLLATSPRAARYPDGASRADRLRFDLLGIAAEVIRRCGGPGHLTNTRRVLAQAQELAPRLLAETEEPEERLRFQGNAAALLDMQGDLALAEGKPEEAIGVLEEALRRHQAVQARLDAESWPEDLGPRLRWGVPNSLRRLADALARAWRLDEAAAHIADALAEYKRLGMPDSELAGHLLSQAHIEVLRANFSRAEALIAQADALRGGMGP
jgi:tetratricopeptide (TPR) repeat protein